MNNWRKDEFNIGQVNCDNISGPIKVKGWIKEGLGICKDIDIITNEKLKNTRGYGVYHLNSGLLVIHSNGIVATKRKAEALIKLTNWENSKEKLQAQTSLEREIYKISKGKIK